MHWNCFPSSVVTDRNDGHGLKLENVGSAFLSFNDMPAKIAENHNRVTFLINYVLCFCLFFQIHIIRGSKSQWYTGSRTLHKFHSPTTAGLKLMSSYVPEVGRVTNEYLEGLGFKLCLGLVIFFCLTLAITPLLFIYQAYHLPSFIRHRYTASIQWTLLVPAAACRRSRDGAVVRALAFHLCGPGSIPGLDVICGLSLLLVLFSTPRGFSPGTPVFPSPQKPTFLNSNSIRNVRAFNTWALGSGDWATTPHAIELK